jgi:hypothetical protein
VEEAGHVILFCECGIVAGTRNVLAAVHGERGVAGSTVLPDGNKYTKYLRHVRTLSGESESPMKRDWCARILKE